MNAEITSLSAYAQSTTFDSPTDKDYYPTVYSELGLTRVLFLVFPYFSFLCRALD